MDQPGAPGRGMTRQGGRTTTRDTLSTRHPPGLNDILKIYFLNFIIYSNKLSTCFLSTYTSLMNCS